MKLNAFIFIILSVYNIAIAQENPCSKILDKRTIIFQDNLENELFEKIISDFSSLDFTQMSKESEAEIRLCVFFAQLSLRDYGSVDTNNFIILLQNINKIEPIECKKKYITIISNLLNDGGHNFPKLSVNLIDIILNYFEFPTQNDFLQIKYYLLTNQYYYTSSLQLFKEAEKIKLKRDQIELPNQKVLENLFSEAYYFLSLSNYNEAYFKLKEADKLIRLDGCSVKDSIGFYITWAKFFKKINRIDDSKLYFKIGLQISTDNGFTFETDRIEFELMLLEEENEKKIEFLEKKLKNISGKQDEKILIAYLDALANAYSKTNQFEKALKTWQTVYSIEKKYHQDVDQITMFNLSYGFMKNNEFENCYSILNEAVNFEFGNVYKNLSYFSNSARSNYWLSRNWLIGEVNQLASKASIEVPFSLSLALNANLISKSLLLETSRELDQAISQSTNEEMKTQFSEMKQLRKLYSKMQSEGSINKELMERYKTQADSLDKILVNSLGEYADSKRKFEITWKDVQSNLTTSDAAIEFAKYFDDRDSVIKYIALVVRPEFEYPKIALLGEEEEISNLIQSKSFSSLYPLVWDPIEEHLKGVERIYYSPAGQLNNVSFSALCIDKESDTTLVASNEHDKNRGVLIERVSSQACNSYLMDKYELHQLTTTRYLADGTLGKERKMNTSIALSGGINYDTIPVSNSIDKKEDNDEYLLAQNLSMRNEDRSSSNNSMGYLQGTKEEVSQIGQLVASKRWEVSIFSESGAEERKVKGALETGQPGIIHIATHGFAFPDLEQNKKQAFMGMEETSYRASEDPMVRCGLMLSGSNISWTGNPQKMIQQTGEDGILTAAEVSNLDLSNTKLVVLSACETGLGKIEGSEGTFGLKRGFKLAGVEQIIVSLWSVPDKETMELMTLFYTDLAQTLNPVVSFEKAQKEMRNRYPTEPDKWAGFVLVR